VWFKVLDPVERGILSLAARVVDRVESVVLGVELVKIMKKLRDALKSGFIRRISDFGFGRARELSRQAVKWGCKVAVVWASELNFVRYLAVMSLNKLNGFGFKIR
jgi:hypothetical protein